MDCIGMYCPGYGFQAVYSGSIYKTESLGPLEQGIIFQEIDQLFEAFSLGLGKQRIATEKYKKRSIDLFTVHGQLWEYPSTPLKRTL